MIIEFWWTRQLSRSWARYYRSFFQEPKVERTTCLREIFKKLFWEQNNIIHVEIYSERRNANIPYKGNACYYSVGMSLKMNGKYLYIYVVCKKRISHTNFDCLQSDLSNHIFVIYECTQQWWLGCLCKSMCKNSDYG